MFGLGVQDEDFQSFADSYTEYKWSTLVQQGASEKISQSLVEVQPLEGTHLGEERIITPQPVGVPIQPAVMDQPDSFYRQYLIALSSHQADQLAVFYAPDAFFVLDNNLLQSPASIFTYYGSYFASLPAGAPFSLVQFEMMDNVYLLIWQVDTFAGCETIKLRDGKIALQYSFLK